MHTHVFIRMYICIHTLYLCSYLYSCMRTYIYRRYKHAFSPRSIQGELLTPLRRDLLLGPVAYGRQDQVRSMCPPRKLPKPQNSSWDRWGLGPHRGLLEGWGLGESPTERSPINAMEAAWRGGLVTGRFM